MKLVKQENAECALAAVCMAKGKSYPKISRAYHKSRGYMFGDASRGPNSWLTDAHEYLEELLNTEVIWFRGYPEDFIPFTHQNISLRGQGVLSVIINGYARHTVAFSQGRIYDPQESYRASWNGWRRRNPGWQVYNKTQVTLDRK